MRASYLRRSTLYILAVLLLATPFAAMAQEKPNIVLMVMDNLGWGEIGVYGGGILRGAETPRLDQLAAEGIRLPQLQRRVAVHRPAARR